MLSKRKLVWSRLELGDSKESELVSAWNSSGLVFVERSELDGWVAYIVVASYSGYAKLDIRSECRSDVARADSVRADLLARDLVERRRLCDVSLDASWMIAGDLYMEDVDRAIAVLLQHLENISSRELDIPARLRTQATVRRNLFPPILAVDDVTWSKIGSVEFLFPRRFFLHLFRRLWWTRKVNANELQCVISSCSDRLGFLSDSAFDVFVVGSMLLFASDLLRVILQAVLMLTRMTCCYALVLAVCCENL
ncbi:hypothetical protein F511_11639 [Dorcoceras hygrometricum]|uniref:Uncharacterized protein n=1 Tax=Dorcoceras hygrometricum TaxID=472368 RepID=A0A2Z7AK04_9LAMI|nr:hypothetical protein F511_11639 [Dorcoceras hygrometricum]